MSKLNWGKKASALFLLCAATALASPAQNLIVLHSFDTTDGTTPAQALIQATDGSLYGTTAAGGNSNFQCNGEGFSCGTIFKITPTGTLTTLHYFDYSDGYGPVGLIQGSDGDFYGMTNLGGNASSVCSFGSCGTIFKMTADGTLTTLYSFCSQDNCRDGANPVSRLVEAADGNFYGTTAYGGKGTCFPGCGTVFKMTPAGMLTTLHAFDYSDGDVPEGLIQATDGSFYGTTFEGGTGTRCSFNCGTVFKVTARGVLTTLHNFSGPDGSQPEDALVQAADGNLYGTTPGGGNKVSGTAFKITPDGVLTTLAIFDNKNGKAPGGMIQATDGNFYGTTVEGGTNTTCFGRCGTVFKITPGGALGLIHNFDSANGSYPIGALVQDTNGNFYGTTSAGGDGGSGTVFSLSVGLAPFVETLPAFGKVGKTVRILGTSLNGATSVTFNGTAATFTVVSSSLITTNVPSGASTGKVQVVTPHGTLSSNVPFRVLP